MLPQHVTRSWAERDARCLFRNIFLMAVEDIGVSASEFIRTEVLQAGL